nr:lysm domain-containing protein [Quercus suber]
MEEDWSWQGSLVSERQSDPSYCLIESYSWEGSDIIRPDCESSDSANETQCTDPTDVPPENERIANLYPDALLCSDCFLKMFYLRVASPYLPDLDYSDYLVQQYYDIISVCNATMPSLLVRTLPLYQYSPGTIDGVPVASDNSTSSLSSTNSTAAAAVACNQTLTVSELGQLSVPDANANGSIYCDAISEGYNVTTGDLQLAFGSTFCLPTLNFTSVCVPAPCTLLQTPDNSTWYVSRFRVFPYSADESSDSMAALISTPSNNITALQFTTWNPNLLGICDQLLPGQYACISAPGGTYVSPPASNATTNEGTQQRGGGSGSGTSTGSGGPAGGGRNATIVTAGGPAPSPIQSGIAPSCTEYAQAQSGDGCYSITSLWDITEADFYTWNTVLGPSGVNCSSTLFAGYYYCIAVEGSTSTTSAPSGTSPTSTATPSPVQSGIDPACTAYAEAKSGDYCSAFASGNNITPADLYQWNPVLGDNGADCNTEFQANTYYCIGVPAATSTTTASVSAPGPTQSGIAANCNKYAVAASGDTCYSFAQDNSITTSQLYSWNAALGSDGSNCSNDFWANESIGCAPYSSAGALQRLRSRHVSTHYHGSSSPDRSPDWAAKSFQTYVNSVHAGINDPEIELLWRCFHFYAYHPFPRDATNAKIDIDAFLRAVSLLATHGTKLLGMQDGGSYHWRFDEGFFRNADFQRIFRSIERPVKVDTAAGYPDPNVTSIVEDTMDVLAMVVPSSISLAPSPDQLEPTARRLLGACGPFQTDYAVFRNDLSTLLRLLLRTRLEKPTWGPGLHLGSFDDAESEDGVLADSLLSEVLKDAVQDDLTIEGLTSIMDLLPQSSNDQRRPDESEFMPARILRAISLFVPRDLGPGLSQTKSGDTRFVLEPPTPRSQEGDVMSLTYLMDRLAPDARPHLVLGSNDTSSPSNTILGAYFPGPLWLQSSQGSERQPVKANAAHLLFQVLPRFRILQWTGPRIPMMHLFCADETLDHKSSVINAATYSGPYTIGRKGVEGTGLCIDPESRTITLTCRTSSGTGDWYEQLGAGTTEEARQSWTATVEHGRLDIYRGSDIKEPEPGPGPVTARNIGEKNAPVMEENVGGAELAKRIKGFGSTR